MELRSAETALISNVQDFVEKNLHVHASEPSMNAEPEARPRVMAQSVRRSASPASSLAADPGLSMAGAQRVPFTSKLSQKQSLFDSRSSESAPWGASAVRLLGAPAAREDAPARSRSIVLAQPVPPSYPEVDKILERQASIKPFSQGEAQALFTSLESALARISAPENRTDACVAALGPEALTSATTLKSRLSQMIQVMKPGDAFEATGQELTGVEQVLECAGRLTAKPSSFNIGAWLLLGGAVAGVIYLLTKSTGKK